MSTTINTTEIELIRQHIADCNDTEVEAITNEKVFTYIEDSTPDEVQEFIEYLNQKLY